MKFLDFINKLYSVIGKKKKTVSIRINNKITLKDCTVEKYAFSTDGETGKLKMILTYEDNWNGAKDVFKEIK